MTLEESLVSVYLEFSMSGLLSSDLVSSDSFLLLVYTLILFPSQNCFLVFTTSVILYAYELSIIAVTKMAVVEVYEVWL